MFHATMAAAIDGVRSFAQADELAHAIWQAHASAEIDDDGAQRLAERLHARRQSLRAEVTPVGAVLRRASIFPPKRTQRSPDRIASRERLRLLAYSGPLPPVLAARFTPAQLAVLRVVRDAVAEAEDGACALCLDAIAARAGVCRRTAQATLRLAEGDGLLTITERPRTGQTNDTNLVRIVSREWQAWMRHATRKPIAARQSSIPAVPSIGCKAIPPTDRDLYLKGKRLAAPRQKSAEGQGSPQVAGAEGRGCEAERAETVRRAMAGLFGR
jgi:hypothetical protein